MTWIHKVGNGLAAYTGLGHSCEYFQTTEFQALLADLLNLVTGKTEADLTPNYQPVAKAEGGVQ